MPASIGVNLRVTGNCRQGGRKYMEDCFSVAYQQTEDEKDLEYAFFGIYDGHGGVEAASFAKEHLMETIIKHKNFWSENDEDVLRAIKDGYIATHYAMWRDQYKWPRTSSGLPSTAGTTASIAFIRRGKIYIGHVGDSGIILGYQEPGCSEWKAKQLTKDHKPESPDELRRIESCGGKVVSKSGVPRVVWNRPKIGHQGPVRRSTPIDEIPFLAVARSLGDLWSYNSQINRFVVSPDPDCSVLPIDTNIHRCLIFGTDGLLNMLSPAAAVHIVQQAERHNECEALSDDYNKVWLNPSKLLVERALDRWHQTKMRADNTSAVTLMLDPPGPPRAQVLKDRKKNLPASGLKIMTRYDDDSAQEESSTNQTNLKDAASREERSARPQVPLSTMEPVPQTREFIGHNSDSDTCETNISTSSSDVSNNLPLKERNFAARESTSFDPREPYRPSEGGKENTTRRSDDTIQINEISSSNIEESVSEDEGSDTGEQENKTLKRKLDDSHLQQRKSLRLSLTQKFLEESKKPAPCTVAEERLKKLAEAAEKSKEQKTTALTEPKTNNNNIFSGTKGLSITQKILQSKKVTLKKKSVVKRQLNRKKLKMVLETVLGKNVKKKVNDISGNTNVTKRSQRGEEGSSDNAVKGSVMELSKPEEVAVISANKIVTTRSQRGGEGNSENVLKGSDNKAEGSQDNRAEKKSDGGRSGRSGRSRKVIVTSKISNFKRQSTRNASRRSKEVGANTSANPSSKNSAKTDKKSIPLKKRQHEDIAAKNKLQVANPVRETMNALPSTIERKSEVGNQNDIKENIKQGVLKGKSKKALPKLRYSLRRRIQDKTKTIKKKVLKRTI
ncbi:uncharacterized protein Pp2C1 [Euwallacea fornicatus]|uniref:uncharacterized protein Pp2C1 n=1 Tax=Euwallacea fornicatus TaxID=995702 RepID=UPI00338F41E0